MSVHEVVEHILPISLFDQPVRWFRLIGRHARTLSDFFAIFRQEFLPVDYEEIIRQELALRAQHPDESFFGVRAGDASTL